MAKDKQIESHHRKHHRSSSSSDEADKSSKRHKHRHHKHHHHRHRHHRDKKRDDEIPSAGDDTEVMDVTPAAPIGVSNGREEDVEEGEILEEEGVGNVLMKTSDSDGESGEIKSNDLVCSNPLLYVFSPKICLDVVFWVDFGLKLMIKLWSLRVFFR